MKKPSPRNNLNKIIKELKQSRAFRYNLACQGHLWFFRLYLGHYLKYPMAWFHNEMFALTEDTSWKLAVIMSFPDSGKSTILNTSFVLWAALGKLQKKFIVIVSHNKRQAQSHLERIWQELCSNGILKNDFGKLVSEKKKLSNSIEIPKYGVRIVATSVHENVQFLRNGLQSPDLIICDDMEDRVGTKRYTETEDPFEWFVREILASGENKVPIVVLGTLLHDKSFLMRIKEMIDNGILDGIFRAYPIVDDEQRILWPGKFPNKKSITQLNRTILRHDLWEREYLLALERQTVLHVPKHMVDRYGFADNADRIFDWSDGVPKQPMPCKRSDYKISAPIMQERRLLFIMPENYTERHPPLNLSSTMRHSLENYSRHRFRKS